MSGHRNNVMSSILWMFFMLIPTVISAFFAFQFRTITKDMNMRFTEEQIVCFQVEQCAIQVNGIWYQITGVIDMSETIPKEYLPVNDEPPQDNPDETSEKD